MSWFASTVRHRVSSSVFFRKLARMPGALHPILEHHGAGTIAKEHAGGAIGPVGDAQPLRHL